MLGERRQRLESKTANRLVDVNTHLFSADLLPVTQGDCPIRDRFLEV